ncbi:MAG: oxaloacetate decarboxylase [Gammaproteobacteria bacterium]|jgi:2-methylisocitrate lyase-like PEP mutase family enzyme|nr:carboxyvinyl-carboxyphosphonate phosphorylmutase [Chromatiales bacterium]MDP6674661.1 oxaloacetate decarboxylase [Gammaproteobacteria bacterium]
MSHARKFRQQLAAPGPIVAPGCFDGLTALLIEQAGFGCAYLSGASIAFTRLGRPDIGLTTMTEVANVISNIRERVDIPLLVDGDTGFGNALNVKRTVRLFERMGASGIQLEDQTLPKRCGHLDGKQLVPVGEMLGKIRAAQDARLDADTVIIARTDAIAVTGLDEALERGNAYIEAGADVLFIESPLDDEQLTVVGQTLGSSIPLLANMVEGGKTPLHSADELAALGFKVVIFPGAMLRMISRAGSEYLAALYRDGTTAGIIERMFDFKTLNKVIGTDTMLADGDQYAYKK